MFDQKAPTLFRTAACLFLSVLAVTACSPQEQAQTENTAPAPSSETLISSDEYVPVAAWDASGIELYAAHKLMGDTLYYMTGKWDSAEGGYREASICRKERDGDAETILNLDGEGEKLILYLLDESENLYYLHSAQNGRDPEYIWTKLSSDDEVLYETIIDRPSGSREQEAFGRLCTSFLGEIDKDGNIAAVNMSGDLYLFDENGRFRTSGKTGWDENTYNVLEYGMVNAGRHGIFLYHVNGGSVSLQQMDMYKGVLTDAAEIKTDSRSLITLELYSGYDQGIYIVDDNSLWQYNFSDEKPITLLNWSDSNISMAGYGIDAVGILPEEKFYIMVHQPGDTASMVEISFRNRAEIPEKQTVILAAGIHALDSLTELVSDFNRQSTEYQVEIQSLEYRPSESVDDYSALYTDLLKGEGPDLFRLDAMGIPNLAAKGVFEDLTPYFVESSLVHESDIIPSVLDVWTMDDKIIFAFEDFNITGLLVKKGTTDQGVWTPDEYIRLAEEHPDSILTNQDPLYFYNEVFYNSIYADLSDYVNWKTGECHLDSEEFISMIERIRQLEQPELTLETITAMDGKEYTFKVSVIGQDENDFYNGLLLTQSMNLFGLPNYAKVLEYGDYAEIAGYPTNKEEPYYDMMPQNVYAINSSSQVKEGAWAFLEFMLSEAHQNTLTSFPVRQDSFDKYLTRTEFNRGRTVVDFTAEELDALRELVKYVHWTSTSTGRDMLPLITEEIEAVWAGDKTPADAARIMQNRVSIFVNEQL